MRGLRTVPRNIAGKSGRKDMARVKETAQGTQNNPNPNYRWGGRQTTHHHRSRSRPSCGTKESPASGCHPWPHRRVRTCGSSLSGCSSRARKGSWSNLSTRRQARAEGVRVNNKTGCTRAQSRCFYEHKTTSSPIFHEKPYHEKKWLFVNNTFEYEADLT